MHRCKAIIFDMDGVLVDSEPVHIHAHERYFKDMGLTLDSRIIYENFIGSTTLPLWTTLKELYHLEKPIEQLMEENRRYEFEQEMIEGFPPIPYIPELLESIRRAGLKLAVASSSPLSRIERTLEALKITDYFDVLVSGTDLARPKPAPDTFLAAAKALGLAPEECLAIEDSGNGVRSAVAAGMAVVGFHNPHSGVQDLTPADFIIEGFEEVDADDLLRVYAHHFHLPALLTGTKRLRLRELSSEDAGWLYEWTRQEDAAFLSGIFPRERGEFEDYLRAYVLHQYPFYGFGLWAALDPEDRILGLYGLHSTDRCEDGELEACWMTAPEYRRQGYAKEAMKAIFETARENWECNHLCAVIAPANLSSAALAKSLGMKQTGEDFYQI